MTRQKDLSLPGSRWRPAAVMLIALLTAFFLAASPADSQEWKDVLAVADSLMTEDECDSAYLVAGNALSTATADPECLNTDIGRIHYKQGVYSVQCAHYARAEESFLQALAIFRDQLGPEDPKVGKILNALGLACMEGGKYEQAGEYLRDCLAIMEEACSAPL